jgi:hypothetical protein
MLTENLDLKFEHIYNIVSGQSFLKMESLGGEVPFFICTYNPQQQNDAEHHIHAIKNRLKNIGIEALELNLYELSLKILEDREILNKIMEVEVKLPKVKFIEAMQGPLDIETILVPNIANTVNNSDCKIVFLTGIGMVYPYIRSHTILYNLQKVIKRVPTLIFFPGEFNGNSLELFGLLKDDNYYRAFNIESLKK